MDLSWVKSCIEISFVIEFLYFWFYVSLEYIFGFVKVYIEDFRKIENSFF